MRRALLLLAVVCLAFAPAPFPRTRRPAPALPTMEGSWAGSRAMLVTATHVTFGGADKPPYSRVVLGTVDDNAAFDLVALRGDDLWWLGIYKVEGQKLTICYNETTRGRPTAFDGPGRWLHTEVFWRVR
jgi:uncharacterized protein (TIGR03067 family)